MRSTFVSWRRQIPNVNGCGKFTQSTYWLDSLWILLSCLWCRSHSIGWEETLIQPIITIRLIFCKHCKMTHSRVYVELQWKIAWILKNIRTSAYLGVEQHCGDTLAKFVSQSPWAKFTFSYMVHFSYCSFRCVCIIEPFMKYFDTKR